MGNPNPNTTGLKPRKEGDPGGPGRPPGKLNKATYARMALDLVAKWPNTALKVMREMYPDLPESSVTELMIYLSQAHKAIISQDTQAAKFLTDTAHGKNPLDGEDGAVLEGADKIVIVYKKEYLESDPLD